MCAMSVTHWSIIIYGLKCSCGVLVVMHWQQLNINWQMHQHSQMFPQTDLEASGIETSHAGWLAPFPFSKAPHNFQKDLRTQDAMSDNLSIKNPRIHNVLGGQTRSRTYCRCSLQTQPSPIGQLQVKPPFEVSSCNCPMGDDCIHRLTAGTVLMDCDVHYMHSSHLQWVPRLFPQCIPRLMSNFKSVCS